MGEKACLRLVISDREQNAPVPRQLTSSVSRQSMLRTPLAFFSIFTLSSGLVSRRVALTGLALLSQHRHLASAMEIDPEYPGTAVERMRNIHERVKSLSEEDLSGDWTEVRRKLLWAGGLRDLPRARPGEGYTGHSLNDFNHCDITPMLLDEADNENEGRVDGIAFRNPLGNGIRIASLEDAGPGGSWSTCMMGCNRDPPADVAHVQFRARIAFKLVWCGPPDGEDGAYDKFVLVDDDGELLNRGTPTGQLPPVRERMMNWQLVAGSKYARACEACE